MTSTATSHRINIDEAHLHQALNSVMDDAPSHTQHGATVKEAVRKSPSSWRNSHDVLDVAAQPATVPSSSSPRDNKPTSAEMSRSRRKGR